jgi:bifunctional NMN adenylyltransferase/nudix hydrolase
MHAPPGWHSGLEVLICNLYFTTAIPPYSLVFREQEQTEMAKALEVTQTVASLIGTREFAIGALPMRAHPPHEAHLANVVGALERSDVVALLVGSSNMARSFKNPLTFAERKYLFEECFPDEVAEGRLVILPMPDFGDNDMWAANTKRIVRGLAAEIGNREGIDIDDSMIALAGFKKDAATGEYLDMFPEWGDILLTERTSNIDATAIRDAYFCRDSVILKEHLPAPVVRFLERFRLEQAFQRLVDEREEIDFVRETFNKDDPQNYTGDLLIRWRNLSLLIKRGGRYGHGLWATPGGIRDAGEDFLTCSLREVDEETGLTRLNPAITIELLKANVKATVSSNKRGRDLRGRYETRLFLIELPDYLEKPIVEPMDDAMHAELVDHETIDDTEWFADHAFLVRDAIRIARAA